MLYLEDVRVGRWTGIKEELPYHCHGSIMRRIRTELGEVNTERMCSVSLNTVYVFVVVKSSASAVAWYKPSYYSIMIK